MPHAATTGEEARADARGQADDVSSTEVTAGVIEQLAVSQTSTPGTTFAQDIATFVASGIGGIGIWEGKIGAAVEPALSSFLGSGLRATVCLLRGGRVDEICASVRRLAAFDPVAIGAPAGWLDGGPGGPGWSAKVPGVRAMARTAATLHPGGVRVAVEAAGSLDSVAALLDEVGEPNTRLVLDAR